MMPPKSRVLEPKITMMRSPNVWSSSREKTLWTRVSGLPGLARCDYRREFPESRDTGGVSREEDGAVFFRASKIGSFPIHDLDRGDFLFFRIFRKFSIFCTGLYSKM